MKDTRIAVRLDAETYNKCKSVAVEGNISQWIRLLIKKELDNMDKKLRDELKELKKKYFDVYDDVCCEKAKGNLAKLCNLRDAFDETFDAFFDREELRTKYKNAWNEEENSPNFDISNSDLEQMLQFDDLKELIQFYKNYIDQLEDELNELRNPEPHPEY